MQRAKPNNFIEEAREAVGHLSLRLEQILEHLEDRFASEQYAYKSDLANTGSATDCTITLTPPPGVIWKVRRIACTSAAASGAVAVYLDSIDPLNLVDAVQNPAITAWGPGGGGIYVPAGRPLLFHFFSQGNNQVCTVNIRVTELEVDK